MKQSQSEQRLKWAARKAVYRAIATGALVQTPCERCGSTENLHQQHEDYNKPLEVTWKCAVCRKVDDEEYERTLRKVLDDDRRNWNRYHYTTSSGQGND